MATSTGEMPFLDHLEELRQRIFWVLGAIVVGVGIGLWLVLHFELVIKLAEPIAPYIPGGKLTLHSPTESVMVVMKLAIALGLVLASPVIIWQLWGFLSPALYQKEKKAIIPTLVVPIALLGSWSTRAAGPAARTLASMPRRVVRELPTGGRSDKPASREPRAAPTVFMA